MNNAVYLFPNLNLESCVFFFAIKDSRYKKQDSIISSESTAAVQEECMMQNKSEVQMNNAGSLCPNLILAY